MIGNERKATLERFSLLKAKIESSAIEHADALHRATYEAKNILVDSYLDVLISLKDKWERNKVDVNCVTRLREVMAKIDFLNEIMNNNVLASDELSCLRAKEVELGAELDVAAMSHFSVGKLDLPQALEDLLEEFFMKVLSEGRDLGRMDDRGKDGEFDVED